MPSPETLHFDELHRVEVKPARTVEERLAAMGAWVSLIFVDLVMKLAGFRRFHGLISSFPTCRKRYRDEEAAAAICTAVDRAATFYFKRAWCLQRSAAAVCLLRLAGIEARLVIGVKSIPFGAHAWVEKNGVVLNDRSIVQERYTAIERI